MAENGSELRRIVWSEAFPFVRLFRTLPLALNANRLLLAVACVLLSYVGGRVQDLIWPQKHGVKALIEQGAVRSEIECYATSPRAAFDAWVQKAREERVAIAERAFQQANQRPEARDLREKLQKHSLRKLLADDQYRGELKELRKLVDARLKAGLTSLDGKKDRVDYDEKRDELVRSADRLRAMLAGKRISGPPEAAPSRATTAGRATGSLAEAARVVLAADPLVKPDEQARDQARMTAVAVREALLQQDDEIRPRGPYISLLKFESHCLAAAVQGVCGGRWGFSAGAFDAQPALLGSLVSAARGVCWFVTQRPWYALLCGLFNLLVLAYFGGALCRSAAIQAARDESISIGDSLRFARQKFGGFVLAPVLPAAMLVGVAVILAIGGLVGAIPWLGELLTGVLYFLALLGGFAAALLLLAVVLGFPLMWPTIAAEGSDGFDALSRACSYVGSRIWHVGFYAGVLLLYGALSLVLVRGVAVLTLKLSHEFAGWGMRAAHSAELDGVHKLDALWQMPAWPDVAFLPTTAATPFWGTFFKYPLDGTETIAAGLMALWVYLVVGLVAAFVVSFFFCGSTQMYFLLRRDVDATDYEEVYYEEPEEEPAAPEAGTGFVTETPAPVTPAPSEPPPTPPAPPPGGEAPPAVPPST